MARVARPLEIPRGVVCITVGGSTLGGSGKTPLAVALCAQAAALGARAVLVSHAHRASGRDARWVEPEDDAALVGDEAVASAVELRSTGARVVSAARRQAAVDLACEWAELLVIDGPLQLAPRRADWSVLAVDADAPWGSGSCPPRGDLRAPRRVLLANADAVVPIRTDARAPGEGEASWHVRGAIDVRTGRTLSLDSLRANASLRLVTNVARPERIARALRAHGVRVTHHVDLGDHSRATPASRTKHSISLLPTKARQARAVPDAAWIDAHLVLSAELVSKVRTLVARSPAFLDQTLAHS